MTRIVCTSPAFGRHGGVPDRLAATGWDLVRCRDAVELAAELPAADFLVVGLPPVTATELAAAPRLRGVLKHGVGTDNIDIAACTAAGIPVLNTPAANADAVAELAVGLMFALARAIPAGHASVASGGWDRRVGAELGGKTLGIVGLGAIGRRLALKARGLGMAVVASDLFPDHAFAAEHGIALADLDALLARADYVSLHVAGNTTLLDAARIAAMKPGARLLNLARGEVVDLDALNAALDAGGLAGAAIDAYAQEPPDTTHPIFANPKVVFMPHSGGDTHEAIERIGLMNIADMETLLAGGRPARVLNPAVFETAAAR
ncbi:MAG: hydroxyacid dehydrogenase [Rhodovulum sulfidophilum]|uniref:Hydroxyacid dehydrogenase n=1 Tax=Rhodovulum sulfidophilum TaxID=35806 RepID=A0A2W5Q1C6_RHOSU|nr:MAG: hydroxyacid dehydrogenase [Rhodovulum sulfidophilum]